ncbi:MAG: methyltransferase domain-containing protein [Deltaproteobacteria bacterium]|nr:MAG: methyltransferase domain-containing protein [Deltaproteobacteria bacterium]
MFISGMSVMAVEMTGLRLLAPYFGTSLIVTTVLIGSMMTFLSVGYWLGGRWGDRHPRLARLCGTTAVAALFVLAIPFIARPILRASAEVLRPLVQGQHLEQAPLAVASLVGGLLGTLALLAVPVTLMGTVSPWAVRLAVVRLEDAGKAAGRLYALSTVGSILGSFLPALVLIPLLGVRNTFIFVGSVLLLVSAAGFWSRGRAAGAGAAATALLLLPAGTIRPMEGLVYEGESLYHFIQVVQEPYGPCPDAYHLYLNEGIGVHSVKCPDPSKEIRGYWTYLAAAPLWMDQVRDDPEVLIVGLAGGTVARQFLEAFPQARVTGVEIDGEVVEVGRRWLDDDDPRIRPVIADGRVFLQATDARYDVILIDAYRQPYIPFHLVTHEFFELVSEHLDDGGVVAVNVASVRGVDRNLAAMIFRTLEESFPEVIWVDATQANDVLYAMKRPTDRFLAADRLATGFHTTAYDRIRRDFRKRIRGDVPGWQEARLLTDDQAPVEMAWDLMTLEYAR